MTPYSLRLATDQDLCGPAPSWLTAIKLLRSRVQRFAKFIGRDSVSRLLSLCTQHLKEDSLALRPTEEVCMLVLYWGITRPYATAQAPCSRVGCGQPRLCYLPIALHRPIFFL